MKLQLKSVVWMIVFAAITGCVSTPPQPVNPQVTAPLLSDTFDTLDEDMWSPAAMTFNEKQLNNFKRAAEEIDNGHLKITTAPGVYSKGGFGSKFSLQGDFDVQADMAMVDVHMGGLYQRLSLLVGERGNLDVKWAQVNVAGGKSPRNGTPYFGVMLMEFTGERATKHAFRDISGSFDGSLRAVRKGTQLTAYYRTGKDGKWKKLGSVGNFKAKEVVIGLRLANFNPTTKRIDAAPTITAYVDNFTVNHADGIIDNEI